MKESDVTSSPKTLTVSAMLEPEGDEERTLEGVIEPGLKRGGRPESYNEGKIC